LKPGVRVDGQIVGHVTQAANQSLHRGVAAGPHCQPTTKNKMKTGEILVIRKKVDNI
jgi:hypothetical protein